MFSLSNPTPECVKIQLCASLQSEWRMAFMSDWPAAYLTFCRPNSTTLFFWENASSPQLLLLTLSRFLRDLWGNNNYSVISSKLFTCTELPTGLTLTHTHLLSPHSPHTHPHTLVSWINIHTHSSSSYLPSAVLRRHLSLILLSLSATVINSHCLFKVTDKRACTHTPPHALVCLCGNRLRPHPSPQSQQSQ